MHSFFNAISAKSELSNFPEPFATRSKCLMILKYDLVKPVRKVKPRLKLLEGLKYEISDNNSHNRLACSYIDPQTSPLGKAQLKNGPCVEYFPKKKNFKWSLFSCWSPPSKYFSKCLVSIP